MNPDTTTEYLGLQLSSPIVVGSCSLTRCPERGRELSIAGAGAIVLPSLFEEQIVHKLMEDGEQPRESEARVEAMCYGESEDQYNGGPMQYLDTIARLKSAIGIPVIASLNGCSGGQWLAFSRDIEQAGADALEVALDCEIADADLSADEVEQCMLDCITEVCDFVDIPVSVKLTPFHTNLGNLVWRLTEAGAAGVVCFAHEPIWQVETQQVQPTLTWSLTPASDINSTLTGVIRVRAKGPPVAIAASGGISTPQDLIKTIVAGADVGMVTSEVFRSGPEAVARLLAGLRNHLSQHGLHSFAEFASNRPAPPCSIRGLEVGCLTRCQEFTDPTPGVHYQSGDRWGHPR